MRKKIGFISLAAALALVLALFIAMGTMAGVVGLFQQCANDDGDGFGGNPGTCSWVNGAIPTGGPGAALYAEGDGVPQRLELTGFVAGSQHSVTLDYQTTKGGKHAYDYLVSYNYSEDWIALSDLCSGITGCTGWAVSTFPIPADPNVSGAGITQVPGNFTILNGTITAASAYTLNGTYAGDSDTMVTITFTATGPNVLITYAGHIAGQVDWGTGNSAVNIAGKPYHQKLAKLDGSPLSSQDNQVEATSIVPPGELIIIKDAIPDFTRTFTFTTSSDTATPISDTFYLDDDGTTATPSALPNNVIFDGLLDGNYTVTEHINPAAHWLLVELACTGVIRNTNAAFTPTYTADLVNKTLSVNLTINEKVTCTFTNQGSQTDVQMSDMSAKSATGSVAVLIFGILFLAGSGLFLAKKRVTNE